VCPFEQHISRAVADRRALPAHDAGEADSAACIRNDQKFGVERVLLVVEQCDAFPGPRLAHRDALS
jgi:hypothetical protein